MISEIVSNDECKLEEISTNGFGGIGLPGIRSIVNASTCRKHPRKKFDFCVKDLLQTEDHLREFVEIFLAHPELVPQDFELYIDFEVSRGVLQSLGNMMALRKSPITKLCVDVTYTEIVGASILLQSFIANPIATPKNVTIKCLSSRRWDWGDLHLDLARLLRCRSCSLEDLHILGLSMSDDVIIHIAASLERNTELLRLNALARNDFTTRATDRLTALLCDRANLKSTYNSNHTLMMVPFESDSKISSYLDVNRKYSDKRLVAVAKIIEVHFIRNFQIDNFKTMGASLLARIVSFINRNFNVWNESFNIGSRVGKENDDGANY